MKSKFLTVLVVLAYWLIGLYSVAIAASAPSAIQLNAGGFGSDAVSSWPVYVAQEKGFFAKEGVQLNFTRSYEQMMALIGGSFDIIGEAADSPILAADKGADILVVYDLSRRPSQFMVLAPGVQTVSELKEKTIGVWKIPSTDQLLTKKFLAKNGIDINTIKYRRIGGSRDRFAALQTRQISATVLSTAYAFTAQEEGMKVVASPADWETFPWTFAVVRRNWAEANRETIVKYVRAVYRATQWLYDPANYEEAVRILSPITKFDDKTMRWALKGSIEHKIYNLEKPSAGVFQVAAEWLLSEGFLSKPFDTAKILDTKYYEQATK
jgi:ABC-type nitrate/sulfonate/bicarbonate transport system substrate-binding protein